ncbi:MAG TPA: MFS transporter [Candidatus Dormibacteraeota bacterium]
MTSAAGVLEARATATARDPNRFRVLAIVAMAQLMIVLDASVVTIALPSAQRALGISTGDRQWALTAYTLAFGSLLLLGGRLADYLGRRRVFVVSLLGFAGASALGGLAQDPAMLFGARALQGAFAAAMAPSALSLITIAFTEPHERARAFGVYGAVSGGGAAFGLIAGGVLTEYLSWRWTLLVNAPIAVVVAVFALRLVRESRVDGTPRYDVRGTLTSTAGLLLLVYGFTRAASDGWGSAVTVGLLSAAGAVLVLFVLLEQRSSNPLLPLRVVLDRNRGGAFVASLLVGIAMFGTFLLLTYYLQGTLGYSALRSGFAFLPFSGGIIAGASLASQILPRLGPRIPLAGGLLVAAIGMALFTQHAPGSTYLAHVLPAEILASLGLGVAFVPMSSAALVGVDPDDSGVASALVNTTQQVGGSLGLALLNTVAASSTASYAAAHGEAVRALATALVHGYTTAFAISAGLLALAVLLTAGIVRASREDLPPATEIGMAA